MFKFKMNDKNWIIYEDSQENIQRLLEAKGTNIEKGFRWHGITCTDDNKIVLDKDLCIDRKRTTLIHELTHCYITSFITHQEKRYDEEMVADIVSNSLDIINAIVSKYFKKQQKKGGDKKKK